MKYIPCISFCLVLGACQILESLVLDPECGLKKNSYRIAGGQNASKNSAPWMVSLHAEEELICGGSLITKAFVLSAAHCVVPAPYHLVARLGQYDLKLQYNTLDNYEVVFIYTHPGFRSVQTHDIAVLKLDREVRYTDFIKPICLAMNIHTKYWQRYLLTVKEFSTTGWGATEYRSFSHMLQSVNLTHIDRTTCRKQYGYNVDMSHICAGSPTRYVCKGDSGSPLGVMMHMEGKDLYFQFGIVSNGIKQCRNVAVFTNVISYTDWIASAISYDKLYMSPLQDKKKNQTPH